MKIKKWFILTITSVAALVTFVLLPLFFGGRTLLESELAIAKPIFESSIDYSKVKIKAGGLLTWIYPGVTLGNIISFPVGSYDETEIRDQALFLHELTHVWQYQNEGFDYLPRALYEEIFTQAYVVHYDEAKSFTEYDVEEQCEIVAEYFLTDNSKFEVYIEEIQRR